MITEPSAEALRPTIMLVQASAAVWAAAPNAVRDKRRNMRNNFMIGRMDFMKIGLLFDACEHVVELFAEVNGVAVSVEYDAVESIGHDKEGERSAFGQFEA